MNIKTPSVNLLLQNNEGREERRHSVGTIMTLPGAMTPEISEAEFRKVISKPLIKVTTVR